MTNDRHSIAESRELISDPVEKAQREVENGFVQYEQIVAIVKKHTPPEAAAFRLKSGIVLQLQDAALRGIDAHAGSFRNTSIAITGSKHEPLPWHEVADEVAEMCSYVNDNWTKVSAVHLAAYILWKLNWIHPFIDGNGRTARALSYLVMCIKLGLLLPGTPSIPEQIAADKGPYYDALEAADAAAELTDVSALEQMLEGMLLKQLLNVPSLSDAAQQGLEATINARIRRAPLELLKLQYGSEAPVIQLWAIGDHIVLQVGDNTELAASEQRRTEYGNPFPRLLAVGGASAVKIISNTKQAQLIREQTIEAATGYAFSLERDASVGLEKITIEWQFGELPAKWTLFGSLYIVRLGTKITRDNFQRTFDLLIAKDLNRSQ
jgi:hypothetical protein